MNSKLNWITLFLTFQILLLGYSDADDSTLNIFKPTTTIRLRKPIQTGDVIVVKGYFSEAGTEASFDIENEKCDWTKRYLDGCIEYDLFLQFHNNKMYRRINIDGTWKHHIDTYYLTPMLPKKFKYTFKVKPDHFEAEIYGYEMAPLNFTEPIDTLNVFRVYGYATVESFSIEHAVSD